MENNIKLSLDNYFNNTLKKDLGYSEFFDISLNLFDKSITLKTNVTSQLVQNLLSDSKLREVLTNELLFSFKQNNPDIETINITLVDNYTIKIVYGFNIRSIKDTSMYVHIAKNLAPRHLKSLCTSDPVFNIICKQSQFWAELLIEKYGSISEEITLTNPNYRKLYTDVERYILSTREHFLDLDIITENFIRKHIDDAISSFRYRSDYEKIMENARLQGKPNPEISIADIARKEALLGIDTLKPKIKIDNYEASSMIFLFIKKIFVVDHVNLLLESKHFLNRNIIESFMNNYNYDLESLIMNLIEISFDRRNEYRIEHFASVLKVLLSYTIDDRRAISAEKLKYIACTAYKNTRRKLPKYFSYTGFIKDYGLGRVIESHIRKEEPRFEIENFTLRC